MFPSVLPSSLICLCRPGNTKMANKAFNSLIYARWTYTTELSVNLAVKLSKYQVSPCKEKGDHYPSC